MDWGSLGFGEAEDDPLHTGSVVGVGIVVAARRGAVSITVLRQDCGDAEDDGDERDNDE